LKLILVNKMLEIKNLCGGYERLNVLKGINLQIKKNQITSLIGPNGAGKSSVIKSICHVAEVWKGDILYNGMSILDVKAHDMVKLGISYVPQGDINFGNLTIKQNLEIGAFNLRNENEKRKNFAIVYEKFPILKQRENDLAYGLSGGQQQLLAFGRALMQSPSMLLLDEPTLGLSPKLQTEIFKLISSLPGEGITILLVEQNAKKAIEISDQTYLLENGRIVLSGKSNILKDSRLKKIYLGGG